MTNRLAALSALSSLFLATPAPADGGVPTSVIIEKAIERGVPVFNRGDHAECARIYEVAARDVLALDERELSSLDRSIVESALEMEAQDDAARAWNLRRAFDLMLDNASFEPLIEAPLPEGFPGPGPLGQVVVKEYPRYRAARAEGRDSFGALFRHITKNDVSMTAPVEMTMSDELRQMDMAFLYEAPQQGQSGSDGRVEVVDLEPMTVLSVGMRAMQSPEAVGQARVWIEDFMKSEGWSRSGPWRLLGYNSPMVEASRRFWELQLPVTRASE